MPTWTLEELTEYNPLLPDDLKLAGDELVSRYDTFGGIPRFTKALEEAKAGLTKAVNSFSELDINSYCKKNEVVKEVDHSHRILQMVPTQANFRASFRLVLSNHIAELVGY
ncbi:hypothetical protein ON010_g10001 [Phytophthora cinnamomi]|nr:hypothetical protein ON010_g10001 [Phytophthora cinnamomi]